MTLQKVFDIATEFAARMFSTKGEVRPMYICETRDGEHLPFAVPMPQDRRDKEVMVRTMYVLFKLHRVERYVFISEGYQLHLPADSDVDLDQYDGKLQDHPDREEVVSFLGEDRNGESISGYYRILRPEHGRARLATLKVNPPSTHSTGRMTGLLQD